jgi:serine/threonine protein kinase
MSESQESLLHNFNAGWDEDRLPEYAGRVPRDAPWRLAALRDLIKVDLRKQWEKGNRRPLESYLLSYPELGTPETVALDLIQAEMQARRRTGDPVTFADLSKRFPRQMGQLQRGVIHVCADPPQPDAASQTALPIAKTQPPAPPPPAPAGPSVKAPGGGPPPDPSTAAVSTLTSAESGADVDLKKGVGRDRYRLARELGRGAMGTVYLAEDTFLQRQVALKIPHFQPGESPELRERFLREARAAAKLDHPNICPVFDVGKEDDRPYLTMAYIEGQTLDKVLRASRPMPQRRAVEVVAKLARAVEYAHEQGVVHRDLKPSNVIIKRRGEPVIMDFGLARRMNQDAQMTHQGSVLGTPAYMSPEQVEGDNKAVGPASDQYALGVILYELLTGQLPFQGTIGQVMVKILQEAPKPPSSLRPDLDPGVEQICLQAMAAKIPDRFASVGEFADALEHFLTPTSTTPDIDLPVARSGSSPDVETGSSPGGSAPRNKRDSHPSGSRPPPSSHDLIEVTPGAIPDALATLAPKGSTAPGTPPVRKPPQPEPQPVAASPLPKQGWQRPGAETAPRPAEPKPGRSFKTLVLVAVAVALGLAIGGAVYWLWPSPPEPPERFTARIVSLIDKGQFKEALEQIQQAAQGDPVKANARKHVRNAVVPWADEQLNKGQRPGEVREVLERLRPHFPGDAQLPVLSARARQLDLQQQAEELFARQRYPEALQLLRQHGADIAEAVWAVELKDRILSTWVGGAEELLKARQFKKAEEAAREILAAEKDYSPAEEVRTKAGSQIKRITGEVDSRLKKRDFEGAHDRLAKEWPNDEARPLKDKIFKQWLDSVQGQRKGKRLSEADAALVALEQRYKEDGLKNEIDTLKAEVARDRVRLPVHEALEKKAWKEIEAAATALTSKDAAKLGAERAKLLQQLEGVWIDLSQKEPNSDKQIERLLPLRDRLKSVAAAKLIVALRANATDETRITHALDLQGATRDELRLALAGSRRALQDLLAKPGGQKYGKRIDHLLALLGKAEEGVERPLSDALPGLEVSLGAPGALTEGDRTALAKVVGRLFALRVREGVKGPPEQAADVKWWEARLADCKKVKEESDTWALACRVECLAELGQVDGAGWKRAWGALREHLDKGQPDPGAQPYASYVRALALAKSTSLADAAKLLTEELGKKGLPPALQAPHRKQQAAGILLAATNKLVEDGSFREPFGPAKGAAATAFSWLELAYRLKDRAADPNLRQNLVLAAWHKGDPDGKKLAAELVPELLRKDVLAKLTAPEVVHFALIHAKTRDAAPAGRKTAVASYQLALSKVDSLLRTSLGPGTPKHIKEGVVLPVCEAVSAELIEPLCAQDWPEQFLAKAPDRELKDQLAHLCERAAEVIKAELPTWTELKRPAKTPRENVITLYDRAFQLASEKEEKAEYLVAEGYAYYYYALPQPSLKKLREYAAMATKIAPKYPGGYGLKGIALIFESRGLTDYKDKLHKLREADTELEEGLRLLDKLGKEKAPQLAGRLYDSLGSVCLDLGNFVPEKSEQAKYFRRGEKYLKELLDGDPRNREAQRTYALLLEDIGLYVVKTPAEQQAYYRRACEALEKAMDRQDLKVGWTLPWLERGRVRVRWAGLGGEGADKLLKAAAQDLDDVTTFAGESVAAAEAYFWLAKLALLEKGAARADRATRFFEQAVALSRKVQSPAWEEEALRESCDFALAEANARFKNPAASKKYAAMCAACANDLEKLNSKAQAAWYLFQSRRLQNWLNGERSPKVLLDILARGLEEGRLQDRPMQFYLRSQRAELYLLGLEVDERDIAKAYADAVAAIKLAKEIALPEEAMAHPEGVAGEARLNYPDAHKYFPEAVTRLRSAIKLGPEHPRSWWWKGILALTLADERYEEKGVNRATFLEEAARHIAEACAAPSAKNSLDYLNNIRKKISKLRSQLGSN